MHRVGLALAIALTIGLEPVAVVAQEEENAVCEEVQRRAERQVFPVSPLALDESDPLLPASDRPLTEAEKEALVPKLDELNAKAQAQRQAGNLTAAFEIWRRELRLRRLLGLEAELKALQRVGKVAWEENRPSQAQVVSRRLRDIRWQVQCESPADAPTLQSVGEAFEAVGAKDDAVAVYRQALSVAQTQEDTAAREATLRDLARVNFRWLDYLEAAQAYEQLLVLAQQQGDRASELRYLQRLAYIYDQLKQPQRAVGVKEELSDRYASAGQLDKLTSLKLAIASDYEALGQFDRAIESYRETYNLAWSNQQFYKAGEALIGLADLYEQREEFTAAVQVYRALLEVHRWTRDEYSKMTAYDRIGRIYRDRQAYSQALQAFQNGMNIARQLNSREAYFAVQIEQIQRRMRE